MRVEGAGMERATRRAEEGNAAQRLAVIVTVASHLSVLLTAYPHRLHHQAAG